MALIRKYAALLLLILFCWYHHSINFSSHIHILNGASVVHSHPGSSHSHSHSEAQFATIDILVSFNTDVPADYCHLDGPAGVWNETCHRYEEQHTCDKVSSSETLRGPPQRA